MSRIIWWRRALRSLATYGRPVLEETIRALAGTGVSRRDDLPEYNADSRARGTKLL